MVDFMGAGSEGPGKDRGSLAHRDAPRILSGGADRGLAPKA
jgi:hypothetical protein